MVAISCAGNHPTRNSPKLEITNRDQSTTQKKRKKSTHGAVAPRNVLALAGSQASPARPEAIGCSVLDAALH